MKRFVLVSLTMLMMMVMALPAQAAGRRSGQTVNTQRQGVFARMMELERRKNAALREMFRR